MSNNHKAALAKGRRQGHVVSTYLEALESSKPKRGRKRTPTSIKASLSRVEAELAQATPANRLELAQRRRDLERDLEALQDSGKLRDREVAFTEVAKEYSNRKGIEYATWREVGVSAAVLRTAGITRSGV